MRSLEQLYAYIEGDPKEVKGPRVIITDRELACMNALSTVFSNAKHLLCQKHIGEDVRKYVNAICSKAFPGESLSLVNLFTKRWNVVVKSRTIEKYNEALIALEDEWNGFPVIIKYIHDTWLDPYRERFVSVWIDDTMHYGNNTTNRQV